MSPVNTDGTSWPQGPAARTPEEQSPAAPVLHCTPETSDPSILLRLSEGDTFVVSLDPTGCIHFFWSLCEEGHAGEEEGHAGE